MPEQRAKIKLHILRCGLMRVSRETVSGGARFYLPSVHALAPEKSRVELPVLCFLIEHPKGRLLVDTGWSRAVSPESVYDAKAAASALTAPIAAYYRPVLPMSESASERLAALGLSPSDIDWVLLTHLDADNVSGLDALGGAKHILCSQEDYWWSCRTVYKLRQPRSLWLSERLETFWYEGRSFGPTLWSKDFFGDGSVMLVHLPGHTDGQFGIVISNNGRFVLLTADAASDSRSWEALSPPGFGFNREAQLKSLRWIRELSADPACLAVLPSHDPSVVPRVIEL